MDRRIVLDVSARLACMFFAMTKQVTVVGEPTMMRIATMELPRKPSSAAKGSVSAGSIKSFTKTEQTTSFLFFMA